MNDKFRAAGLGLRLITAAVLAAVLIAAWVIGGWYVSALVSVLALVGLGEFLFLFQPSGAWVMKILGLVLGAIVSVFADRHYTRFETQAVWWAQILKVVLGLALTLAVRVALKAPLTAAFGANSVGDGIRYFAVVLMAGTLWPMTFGWFSLMGRKK